MAQQKKFLTIVRTYPMRGSIMVMPQAVNLYYAGSSPAPAVYFLKLKQEERKSENHKRTTRGYDSR